MNMYSMCWQNVTLLYKCGPVFSVVGHLTEFLYWEAFACVISSFFSSQPVPLYVAEFVLPAFWLCVWSPSNDSGVHILIVSSI